jgi:hypothetical protein
MQLLHSLSTAWGNDFGLLAISLESPLDSQGVLALPAAKESGAVVLRLLGPSTIPHKTSITAHTSSLVRTDSWCARAQCILTQVRTAGTRAHYRRDFPGHRLWQGNHRTTVRQHFRTPLLLLAMLCDDEAHRFCCWPGCSDSPVTDHIQPSGATQPLFLRTRRLSDGGHRRTVRVRVSNAVWATTWSAHSISCKCIGGRQ